MQDHRTGTSDEINDEGYRRETEDLGRAKEFYKIKKDNKKRVSEKL